ncbi:MAG: hypothetical protein HZB40_16715 [Rhodocyclales bacterium]|nr:hypothetical protein [Rhodocyclales bacterium]
MDVARTAGVQEQQFGKAMLGLGDQLAKLADQQAEQVARTRAKEIDIELTKQIDARQYHPQNGFMAQQGRNAVEGYQGAVEDIQKLSRNAIDQAGTDPYLRELVGHVAAARSEFAIKSISIHATTENKNWQFHTSEARAETTLQAAASNYADADGFIKAVVAARDEAAAQGKLKGWDDAEVKAKQAKYTDEAYRMRYEAWRLQDSAAALADFMANAGSISPLVRGQIANNLFHHAAPALAASINATGGPGIVAGPGGDAGPLPRGIRNNNPGNVMRGDTKWEGEVDGNDPRYASFDSPEAGIRATARTLLTYQDKHGLNTVRDIVARWAPATGNDTAAYVAAVAKAVGVKPDAALDLHDAATLGGITRAIIKHENGQQPYTDQQINAGIAAANGGELPKGTRSNATAQRDPSLTTGNPVVDALPSDWKLHVFNVARTQAAQDMAAAREQLKSKVQDAQAAYLTMGSAPNPPSETEFLRAFGQADGTARYRSFQDVARLGQQIQQVRTLPADSLKQLRAQAKPTPGDGFAEKQHNYEILTKAIDQVQQARQKDPVAYAMAVDAYGIKPFQNLGDVAAVTRQLAARAAAAPRMAGDYGTAPALLTDDERRVFSDMLKAAPVEQQKTYLSAMYQGVGDMDLFKRTMQSIAPDRPTVAIAGIYQAKGLRSNQGQDVADLILRGQAILTPNSKEDGSSHQGGKSIIKMPEEKLMLSEWNSATGDAFKGKEQAADLFQQTARAIYAARSAEEGDYSGNISVKRWRSAIELATGGLADHNGARVVMPYGMELDKFRNIIKAEAPALVRDFAPPATTARDLERLPLENIGDGRYLFRRGAGYVPDKNGRPLVIDVGARR